MQRNTDSAYIFACYIRFDKTTVDSIKDNANSLSCKDKDIESCSVSVISDWHDLVEIMTSTVNETAWVHCDCTSVLCF